VDARTAERLFGRLDGAAGANRFSGVVSVLLGPELEFERAYGYADRANQIANTMRTRFGTASATKAFTALAVVALMEEGRLALDTSVTEVLDVALPRVSRDVTIEHLLTHRSGVGDYYDEDVVTDFADYHLSVPWYRLERPRDYVPLLAELPPKFTPGERFSYSNSGFVLLGLIVEELAGVPYQEFVKTRIFDRAGMSEAGFFRFDQLPESTALGYVEAADGSWRTNVYNLPVVGGPDGGAFLTAADMARLWSSLHGDLIVGCEWTERFLRPHVSAGPPGLAYGLGVWIHERPDGRAFHFVEGADAGVTFKSLHDAKTGVEYTVACNAPPGATEIVKLLDDAILEVGTR
jgi:CubicO group peptidase (beta-lactamase class C family)